MQEALVAKLQPGVKDSPINDGLVQAINLVEAFLNSYRESPAELEALKAQVKRVMMSQVRWVGEGKGGNGATKRPAYPPFPHGQTLLPSSLYRPSFRKNLARRCNLTCAVCALKLTGAVPRLIARLWAPRAEPCRSFRLPGQPGQPVLCPDLPDLVVPCPSAWTAGHSQSVPASAYAAGPRAAGAVGGRRQLLPTERGRERFPAQPVLPKQHTGEAAAQPWPKPMRIPRFIPGRKPPLVPASCRRCHCCPTDPRV